jgi:hypothetical protein
MATAIVSGVMWNGTTADFRTWGLMVSTQLAAMGLVQTSDTGQINWTTVVPPSGTNTSAGYEIWRFNDVLQTTAPVFLKVDYGSAALNIRPSVWFQFGRATNGAGALQGSVSPQYNVNHVTNFAGSFTHYFAGGPNRFFCLLGGYNSGNVWGGVSFERSKDASGNDTGEAILGIQGGSSGAGWAQFAWNTSTGATTESASSCGALLPAVGTGASGSQISFYPIWHSKGVFHNPGMNALVYFNSDVGAGTPISVTVYGSAHTYYPLGTGLWSVGAIRAATATSLLVRWE